MSKCMTIADESIDQKDTCTEIAPKDIVEFILEEVLLSALILSDKGCSRIGDFSVTEDFCQQYDRLPFLTDFEQVNCTGNPSATNQESTGKSTDRSLSLVTAKENLELIIDSFVKKEEKIRSGGECTIITEDILADNELQIQNGQSHIEKNNSRGNNTFPEAAAREYFGKKDVFKDEKIEIQYYNEGKLNKIYVPLVPSNRLEVESLVGVKEEKEEKENEPEDTATKETESKEIKKSEHAPEPEKKNSELTTLTEDKEKPLKSFSTDEFSQVFTNGAVDPNRPRACAFGEEDVKKIIKEIEEISFSQSHATSDDSDVAIHPDGQGDADLESRSFTRSKDSLEKTSKIEGPHQQIPNNSLADLGDIGDSEERPEPEDQDVYTSEEILLAQQFSEKSILYRSIQLSSEKMIHPEGELQFSSETMATTGNVRGEKHLQYQVTEEETLLSSKVYNDQTEEQTQEHLTQDLNQDFRKDYNAKELPLWEATGNRRGSQQDFSAKKNFELTSERESHSTDTYNAAPRKLNGTKSPNDSVLGKDMWTFSENPAEMLKASRSENDAQSHSTDLKHPSQQSTVSMTVLSSARMTECGFKANSFIEKQSSEMQKNNSQESDSGSIAREKTAETSQIFDGITESMKNREQSPLEDDEKDTENLEDRYSGQEDSSSAEEQQSSQKGFDSPFDQVALGESGSQESLDGPKESDNKDIDLEVSTSSPNPSQTRTSSNSLAEEESAECSDAPPIASQNFRLRSPKMYSGVNHEPDGQAQQECTLTESEEAFIDETESILQIIEPEEHSGDENSSKVSFSLLSEISHGEASAPAEQESESEFPLQNNSSSETETSTRKVYSGMTTIGPLKNTDYDPKDLTLPNIDYGKMTRITSSRQLAKEIDLFGPELPSTVSVKIIEDDSDDDLSLNAEDDHIDLTSLVNRDIASLTKVQKVREVMSHHPKPEDDFEDDDVLPRPRLDLKDVESMTDERYKVPDVTIPLLSLEISDSNGPEKELIENMGLVLSSLTNPAFYEEEFDVNNLETSKEQTLDKNYIQAFEECDVDKKKSENSTSLSEKANSNENEELPTNHEEESISQVGNPELQTEDASSSPKYGTLGSVFRKASCRFIRKDSDSFLRNSKSLPRDTSKITTTESIRSILDDCQSSASSMLKKSKSLLKNTQSIFKSMSSSRVSSEAHEVNNKKVSPSDSDVSTLEGKLSSLLRKDDFAKAKNLIKSKVEKTLQRLDSGSLGSRDKASEEKKNLAVVVRDEDKLRVDRMENFKKLLPKSPLVYKSQFVKSQMSVQSDSPEVVDVNSNCNATDGDQNNVDDGLNVPSIEESNVRSDRISVEETGIQKQSESALDNRGESETKLRSELEKKVSFENKLQWMADGEELQPSTTEEDSEPRQPEYIVMETIQGLPTSDLDSPSREKDSETAKQDVERETGNAAKNAEAFDSFGACADGANDVAPYFPDLEEDKMTAKTPSERKIKTKKKKFTARFRSFWCSAFGRVKTSPKKTDRS